MRIYSVHPCNIWCWNTQLKNHKGQEVIQFCSNLQKMGGKSISWALCKKGKLLRKVIWHLCLEIWAKVNFFLKLSHLKLHLSLVQLGPCFLKLKLHSDVLMEFLKISLKKGQNMANHTAIFLDIISEIQFILHKSVVKIYKIKLRTVAQLCSAICRRFCEQIIKSFFFRRLKSLYGPLELTFAVKNLYKRIIIYEDFFFILSR